MLVSLVQEAEPGGKGRKFLEVPATNISNLI